MSKKIKLPTLNKETLDKIDINLNNLFKNQNDLLKNIGLSNVKILPSIQSTNFNINKKKGMDCDKMEQKDNVKT